MIRKKELELVRRQSENESLRLELAALKGEHNVSQPQEVAEVQKPEKVLVTETRAAAAPEPATENVQVEPKVIASLAEVPLECIRESRTMER